MVLARVCVENRNNYNVCMKYAIVLDIPRLYTKSTSTLMTLYESRFPSAPVSATALSLVIGCVQTQVLHLNLNMF